VNQTRIRCWQERIAHVEKFYETLKEAGTIGEVFVVKGDHDDDFEGSYDVQRINSTKDCHEISGKLIVFNELRILGLGYNETHYLRTLQPLVQRMRGIVDIVLAHVEQSRLLATNEIRPKIVVRGHFMFGVSRINDVLVVGGRFPDCYSIIEMKNHLVESVDTWYYCGKSREYEKCSHSCLYTPEILKLHKSQWPWLERVAIGCPLNNP
jgi:hypothetical protein